MNSPSPFISNARTLDELKREFVSDIQRRLHHIDFEMKEEKRASRSTALAAARRELEMLAEYWQRVTVTQRRRKEKSDAI